MALLVLRTMPIDSSLLCLGELAGQRRLRTVLPTTICNTDRGQDKVMERLVDRQGTQEINHNKSGVSPLIPGQKVSVLGHQDHKAVGPNLRSYTLSTNNGSTLCHSRVHLHECEVANTLLNS